MIMKTLYCILILLISSSSYASILFGNIKPIPKDRMLILKRLNYETRKNKIIDTIKVNEKGFFQTSINITEPIFYSLGLQEKDQLLTFILKPNDTLTIEIDSLGIRCNGSVETQYLLDYENFRLDFIKKYVDPLADSVDKAYDAKDKIKSAYWNNLHNSARQLYKAELNRWVMQPYFIQSFAAIHHSLRWDADKDRAVMDSTLFYLKKNYPTNLYTKQLENKILKIKRISLGAIAPNFSSIDPKGNNVTLNEIKANYILLDFWASWCGPCRKESPSMAKAYQLYKEKGFEIISISLDDKETKWKKAILKDQYTWINVSELKGSETAVVELYSISSIPANFLLDKDGKIIAKNLRGDALEKKLEELFK